MGRQIALYKDKEHLVKLCHYSVWIECFLMAFFVLFYSFATFMLIEFPEDDLGPVGVSTLSVGTVFLLLLWWFIFKYYAFDLIVSMEIQDDSMLLHSLYKTYDCKLKDVILLKEGFSGENMVIEFKTDKGKVLKKYFKKFIIIGFQKMDNLNLIILKDILDIEN